MLHPGATGEGPLAGAALSLEGSQGTLGPLQLPPQPSGAALVLQYGNVGDVRGVTLTALGSPVASIVVPGALSHAVVADNHSSADAQATFVCRACLDGVAHATHRLQPLRPGSDAAYQVRLTVTRGPAGGDVALQLLVMGSRGGGGVQQCVVPAHATVGLCGLRKHYNMYRVPLQAASVTFRCPSLGQLRTVLARAQPGSGSVRIDTLHVVDAVHARVAAAAVGDWLQQHDWHTVQVLSFFLNITIMIGCSTLCTVQYLP